MVTLAATFGQLRRWALSSRLTLRKGLGVSVGIAGLAIAGLGVCGLVQAPRLFASDHDDGDIDSRSRALSLTDLYVFREQDQNSAANGDDLVFVMNTNPRSVAQQQYYFSSQARYEFKVSRVSNKNGVPTGQPDLTFRFTFSPPNRNDQQQVSLTVVEGNRETKVTGATAQSLSTSLKKAESPILNQVRVKGQPVTFFAGLREDPFFFDVEQYFRLRAFLLGNGPAPAEAPFRSSATARDFAAGYNVNTIVMRVPRRVLEGPSRATTFDVWLSLAVRDPQSGRFVQTEQLARPGINELTTTGRQEIYDAYNRIQPTRVDSPEAIAVRADIKKFLVALGNSNQQADQLLRALLPDVMRIDTTVPSGYLSAVNSLGAPIGGRLLDDDVVDNSLFVLTGGQVQTDNVSYFGAVNNPAQGHDPLEQQFPYLALPN